MARFPFEAPCGGVYAAKGPQQGMMPLSPVMSRLSEYDSARLPIMQHSPDPP
jgi:hypothetical protein